MAALKTMGMTLPDIPRVMIEVPSGDEAAFELTVPAGTGCLFVNGGIYMTFGTAETDDDMFRGKYIGTMIGMEASGDSMADLDVDLDTPLSSTVLMSTSYTVLPDAYDEQEPLFGIDFGESGTVWFEGADAGNYIFSAPLFTSPWTDGTILVVNTAGVVVEDGVTTPGADRPEGFNLDRSVTSFEDYALETFGPQSAPSPPTIMGWTGAAISSLPPPSATMGRALVTNEAGGEPVARHRALVVAGLHRDPGRGLRGRHGGAARERRVRRAELLLPGRAGHGRLRVRGLS